MDISILEEIGLTMTEAKIYLMLLKEGESLAGRITRNTGIHRRSVYDALERLIEKGLVSYIKTNNRKYFQAVNPNRLLEILHEKEENVKSIIGELEALEKFSREKKQTVFFRGKQAMKEVFDDQLRYDDEIKAIGNIITPREKLEYYFQKFDMQRNDKKIRLRVITNKKIKKKIPICESKVANMEHRSEVSIYIYGNNVSIVSWSDNPITILIKEKEIADWFKDYFELGWKS